MSAARGEKPAFSFPVKVSHVSVNPLNVTFEADRRECAALADLWDVSSVERFSGALELNRWKRDGVRVKGLVEAVIEQPCVVTLDPVKQTISETIDALFVPENSKLARIGAPESGEILIDSEGPDMPETFEGDTLDAGAVAAEFAALSIDPFPRKPGVQFDAHVESTADDEDDKPPSPFAAALKNWSPKPN